MTTASPQPPLTHTDHAEVVLVGNPNTGKSTLFNRLTGARQRVGNYPGVTVEKKSGSARCGDQTVTIIDLPGTYSLAAISADERVVIDALTGHLSGMRRPDLVVCVVDATNLIRNLFLASQVADTGLPIVVALNMIDAAKEQHITLDLPLLSERLGVPVIPTVGNRNEGVTELRAAIAAALNHPPKPHRMTWPPAVEAAADLIAQGVRRETGTPIERAEALRLLFDIDSSIADRLHWSAEPRHKTLASAHELLHQAHLETLHAESILRYGYLAEQLEDAVHHPTERPVTRTESIDQILTHRIAGLVVFIAVMYFVFWSIYSFAAPFMDMIDAGFSVLSDWARQALAGTPVLADLVADGIIAGVGGVLVFLPQILILFFFISLLEDTGYMARAAFLMDKLFSWCGLSGKSFVPMLSSYACAIPGVMATRTIEDPKARLTTILIAPLMSCSARLPVYILLIGAFIEPKYGAFWASFALFVMHFVGLIVALPIAFVLNKLVFKGRASTFVMEMPPYRVPAMADVLWRMWIRAREFLLRAGTIILAMTVIIWALTYFPRPDSVRADLVQRIAAEHHVSSADADKLIDGELADDLDAAYLEQSYMGRMGKIVQPIFAPAGFDWKITVGVLSSFPARETIIATLGILYQQGGDVDEDSENLRKVMADSKWPDGRAVFTPVVSFAIMVFFALCMQCGATLAVIARESAWKWSLFVFVYMTVLAWIGAVATYQIGTALFG
ncbi:MAG: ferrous iron transport protein B [Planctomycetes bacterium]|nr:ferrous iron transport protein B [Planctomycetota bacterium]